MSIPLFLPNLMYILLHGLKRYTHKKKEFFNQSDISSSTILGFPCVSDVKESACNAGDLGLILGLGRSPGGGYGSPLQFSCLESPMNREAWWLQSMGLHRVGQDWVTNIHTQNSGTAILASPFLKEVFYYLLAFWNSDCVIWLFIC